MGAVAWCSRVDMVAAVVAGDGHVVRTIAWKNPSENGLVLELLAGLDRAGLLVEAVMESSGTYGDVLRHQLVTGGVPVYRVSGKRTHDAAEVYDGVPSLHDAKSAAIIAKLHLDGMCAVWVTYHGFSGEAERQRGFVRCKPLLASAARHALVGRSCVFSDERHGHLYARPSAVRRRKATPGDASEHATDGLSIQSVSGRVNGSHLSFTVNVEVQANSALREAITREEILKATSERRPHVRNHLRGIPDHAARRRGPSRRAGLEDCASGIGGRGRRGTCCQVGRF